MKELCKPSFKGVVMVCDDNSMNAIVICDQLKRVGLEVIIAQSGNDGVEKVQKRAEEPAENNSGTCGKKNGKQFDLIFMDIHMPDMDGLEASMNIKEIDSNIPIIALTTDEKFENHKAYEKNGIVGYLGKPFKPTELWQCLMRHLTPLDKQ